MCDTLASRGCKNDNFGNAFLLVQRTSLQWHVDGMHGDVFGRGMFLVEEYKCFGTHWSKG
jgi:hypothetical protein